MKLAEPDVVLLELRKGERYDRRRLGRDKGAVRVGVLVGQKELVGELTSRSRGMAWHCNTRESG